MTVQNAIDLVRKQLIGFNPSKYAEYSTCFVFYFRNIRTTDGAISVNKKTGEIKPFRPDIVPPDEADSAEIKNVSEELRHFDSVGRMHILGVLGKIK